MRCRRWPKAPVSGIPLVFKDNARNHVETDPRQGIGAGAGAFSQFPKEAGLAAAALGEQFLKEGKATTGDMSVIKTFTDVMGQEYNAVGLRAMYLHGRPVDRAALVPRARGLTEDADLNANIMKSLVQGLQGSTLKDGTSVKHQHHGHRLDDEALSRWWPARTWHGPALLVWQIPAVQRQLCLPHQTLYRGD
jgi:beta-glucosidase-like glycosyl hydrolase